MKRTKGQCLKAFLDSPGADLGQLLKFVDGRKERVRDWLKDKGPQGFTSLRLNVYLYERGFIPDTYCDMQPDAINMARVVAHNLFSFQDVKSDVPFDEDYFFRTLVGTRPLTESVAEKYRLYFEVCKDKLPIPIEVKSLPVPQSSIVSQSSALSREELFNRLRDALHSAEPLINLLLSKRFTHQDRRAFREHCGYTHLSQTSTNLNRLLGE